MGSRRCKKKLWKIIKKWAIKKLRTASSNINNKKNKKTTTKFEQKKGQRENVPEIKGHGNEKKQWQQQQYATYSNDTVLADNDDYWKWCCHCCWAIEIVAKYSIEYYSNYSDYSYWSMSYCYCYYCCSCNILLWTHREMYWKDIEFFLVVQQGNKIDPMKDIIKEE